MTDNKAVNPNSKLFIIVNALNAPNIAEFLLECRFSKVNNKNKQIMSGMRVRTGIAEIKVAKEPKAVSDSFCFTKIKKIGNADIRANGNLRLICRSKSANTKNSPSAKNEVQ